MFTSTLNGATDIHTTPLETLPVISEFNSEFSEFNSESNTFVSNKNEKFNSICSGVNHDDLRRLLEN